MTPHAMMSAAALVAALCRSCVAYARFRSFDVVVRRDWVRQAQLDRPMLRLLDGAVIEPAAATCGCGMTDQLDGFPAIEQVVAELRRLDRARCSGLTRTSRKWSVAVEGAYDRWLQVACHYLAVSHHLFSLTDAMDRELERLRIEGELTAAGLPIRR